MEWHRVDDAEQRDSYAAKVGLERENVLAVVDDIPLRVVARSEKVRVEEEAWDEFR